MAKEATGFTSDAGDWFPLGSQAWLADLEDWTTRAVGNAALGKQVAQAIRDDLLADRAFARIMTNLDHHLTGRSTTS